MLVGLLIAILCRFPLTTRQMYVTHQAMGIPQRPRRTEADERIGADEGVPGLLQLGGYSEDFRLMDEAGPVKVSMLLRRHQRMKLFCHCPARSQSSPLQQLAIMSQYRMPPTRGDTLPGQYGRRRLILQRDASLRVATRL